MTQERFRSSKRLTITLPQSVYDQLIVRSNDQGRSVSNLSSYLLERAVSDGQPPNNDFGGWQKVA